MVIAPIHQNDRQLPLHTLPSNVDMQQLHTLSSFYCQRLGVFAICFLDEPGNRIDWAVRQFGAPSLGLLLRHSRVPIEKSPAGLRAYVVAFFLGSKGTKRPCRLGKNSIPIVGECFIYLLMAATVGPVETKACCALTWSIPWLTPAHWES